MLLFPLTTTRSAKVYQALQRVARLYVHHMFASSDPQGTPNGGKFGIHM